jgi:hypothetical protein
MKQMYKQTIRQTGGNTEEQMDRPREGKKYGQTASQNNGRRDEQSMACTIKIF